MVMKQKLMSRKFWIAIFTNIVSLAVVFSKLGGNIGIVAGIIGVVGSSAIYMITESKIDAASVSTNSEELLKLIENLKKKEGE